MNLQNITKDFGSTKGVNQSDIAGALGNGAVVAGAVLTIFSAGATVIVPLTVLAIGAGVYQMIAGSKGWTAFGEPVELSTEQQAQAAEMTQALNGNQADLSSVLGSVGVSSSNPQFLVPQVDADGNSTGTRYQSPLSSIDLGQGKTQYTFEGGATLTVLGNYLNDDGNPVVVVPLYDQIWSVQRPEGGPVTIKTNSTNGSYYYSAKDGDVLSTLDVSTIEKADGSSSHAIIAAHDGAGTITVDNGTAISFSAGQSASVDNQGQISLTSALKSGETIKSSYDAQGLEIRKDTLDVSGKTIQTEIITPASDGGRDRLITNYDSSGSIVATVRIVENADGSGTITRDEQVPIIFRPGQTASFDEDGLLSLTTKSESGGTVQEYLNAPGQKITVSLTPDGGKFTVWSNADGSGGSSDDRADGTVQKNVVAIDDSSVETNFAADGTIISRSTDNADGSETRVSFNLMGRISSIVVINADGSEIADTYLATGRMRAVVDASGWTTVTEYNPDGSLANSFSMQATVAPGTYADGVPMTGTWRAPDVTGIWSDLNATFYANGNVATTTSTVSGVTQSTYFYAGNLGAIRQQVTQSAGSTIVVNYAPIRFKMDSTQTYSGGMVESTKFNADGSFSGVMQRDDGLTVTYSVSAQGILDAAAGVQVATAGRNTLRAGPGKSTLIGGGVGANTYAFNVGDGNTTIMQSASNDVVLFGAGIDIASVSARSYTVGGMPVVRLDIDVGGSVTIDDGKLKLVYFANGTVATLSQLLSPTFTLGTTTYSSVSATAGAGVTTLHMTGSADVSAAANDLNDVIIANKGNDTLIAGAGSATLVAGGGTATYVVNQHSGKVTIQKSRDVDRLQFGVGITAASLSANEFTNADGTHTAIIQVNGSSPIIIDHGEVNKIKFADGSNANLSTLATQLPGTVSIYSDGSYHALQNNGGNNFIDTYYNATGIKASDSWTKGDGTSGNDWFNADGTSITRMNDGHGFTVTTFLDGAGHKTSDTWSKSDGGSGNDWFYTDGTLISKVNDGHGYTITATFDPTGRKTMDTWTKSDGSSGNDTFNANGSSSSSIKYADGHVYYFSDNGKGNTSYANVNSSGRTTDSGYRLASGAHGSTTYYVGGSSSSVDYNAVGILIDTWTMDAAGNFARRDYDANGILMDTYTSTVDNTITQTYFDVIGRKLSDTWQKQDGTKGSDIFNVDGSSIATTQYVDGTSTVFTDDGRSNVTTLSRDAAGKKVSDVWSYSGGAFGTDIFDGNGSVTSNVLVGGTGSDTLVAGSGATFIAGGAGSTSIELGSGTAVVAFNADAGSATITVGTGRSNTLSLGGGINYSNLAFSKSGNDLILKTGDQNAINLTNWYSDSANQNFVTLQVLEKSASTFNPASANVLYDQAVEEFDFSQLVTQFDAARTVDPSLTSWGLMDSLLSTHLGGSDVAAMGGDLAYYHGLNGNLNGLDLATAQTTLQASSFGKSVQAIDAWGGISNGSSKLH